MGDYRYDHKYAVKISILDILHQHHCKCQRKVAELKDEKFIEMYKASDEIYLEALDTLKDKWGFE